MLIRPFARCAILTSALLPVTASGSAQEASTKVQVNIWKPEKADPTDDRIKSINIQQGLKIGKFAEKMGNARMMVTLPDGSILVTRPAEGDVVRLMDKDGDGRAETRETALRLPHVHGICIHDNRVYLSTVKDVHVCGYSSSSLGEPRKFIDDLPDGGQHPNRTLAVGPDGALYISIGSSCNACNETNPEHATMVRVSPELLRTVTSASQPDLIPASKREVFATGLRNTLAFGWHPRGGEMWGVDQGIDDLDDDENREEINRIIKGKHYGWPHVYEDRKWNNSTFVPPGKTKDGLLAANTAPVLTHDAHSSPIAMVFVADAGRRSTQPADATAPAESRAGPWPKDMQDDALVTFRGSWNRKPPSGYELVRIKFRDGKAVETERLIGDFLAEGGKAHFGRIAGLAWAADGSLLMSDDTCGVIYRIYSPSGSGGDPRDSGPRMGD